MLVVLCALRYSFSSVNYYISTRNS